MIDYTAFIPDIWLQFESIGIDGLTTGGVDIQNNTNIDSKQMQMRENSQFMKHLGKYEYEIGKLKETILPVLNVIVVKKRIFFTLI